MSLFSSKSFEVNRRINNGPKTLTCGTLDTTLTSLVQQPSDLIKTVSLFTTPNLQYPQSNLMKNNSQMVDYKKGCAEVNLHNPSLLPTPQWTLPRMEYLQKCVSFPISKLGGWKHTTAFHKSSKMNRHQMLKHLRQHWCNRNCPAVGNRLGQWSLWNWGDIGMPQTSRKSTHTKKPPKHLTSLLELALWEMVK